MDRDTGDSLEGQSYLDRGDSLLSLLDQVRFLAGHYEERAGVGEPHLVCRECGMRFAQGWGESSLAFLSRLLDHLDDGQYGESPPCGV